MQNNEQGNDLLKEFEPIQLELLDDHTRQLVNAAKSIFNELARLIKSITLYGAKHQSSLNFRTRFFEVITQALAKGDDITVEVQTYAFVLADQIIYEDPKVDGNFIYKFYTDGLRSLTFKRGISSQEVDKLLNIFLLDWSNPALFEDDSVTMIWSQRFENIKYSVADGYNEDTQEADTYYFNFTDELNRLIDYCHTSNDFVILPSTKLKWTVEEQDRVEKLIQVSKRELLEKLISLSHETQSQWAQVGGVDRFVQLSEQLAQLFAQNGEISELERMMRQAFYIASEKQCTQLLENWTVPIFMQNLFKPLQGQDDPSSLSALACIQLLGSSATPYIAKGMGEAAEHHLDTLSQMMLPHIDQHPIELCRVVKTATYLHNKKLIPLLYTSQNDDLCIKVFQTSWSHEDQGVRYEGLLNLPERLYDLPLLSEALIQGLSDPYSKIRTLACFRLSKLKDESSRVALKDKLEKEAKQLSVIDLRKLYAALAMMGEPSVFFTEQWSKHDNKLRLTSLAGKGKEEGHSILIGLALSQDGKKHQEILQKESKRKFAGVMFVEAAEWGQTFLKASDNNRDQMIYELFFRSQLSTPRGSK